SSQSSPAPTWRIWSSPLVSSRSYSRISICITRPRYTSPSKIVLDPPLRMKNGHFDVLAQSTADFSSSVLDMVQKYCAATLSLKVVWLVSDTFSWMKLGLCIQPHYYS